MLTSSIKSGRSITKMNNRSTKRCRHCYWWEYVNWHTSDQGKCTYPYKDKPCEEELDNAYKKINKR